jgi:hypothetical protein
MEFYARKAVKEDLANYCHLSKAHSFMEVTEWANGEGWDISINDEKFISLTHGELQLLAILTSIRHD